MKQDLANFPATEKKIILWHDFTEESKKAKEVFENVSIPYYSVISEPEANRFMPFIFLSEVPTSIKGLEEIKNYIFEELKKDKKAYYSKIVVEKTNPYIQYPEDVWMLESLVGEKEVFEALIENQMQLTTSLIENLFEKSGLRLYTDKARTILTFSNFDLLRFDFGELELVDLLDSLKKYGIVALEEAKEKTYVKIK